MSIQDGKDCSGEVDNDGGGGGGEGGRDREEMYSCEALIETTSDPF